jgi:hypothetical protein
VVNKKVIMNDEVKLLNYHHPPAEEAFSRREYGHYCFHWEGDRFTVLNVWSVSG